MRSLSKILVLIALLCAAGYTLLQIRRCNVIGVVTPAAGALAPSSRIAGDGAMPESNSALVYPNASALQALKLGYSVFETHPDGSMMAVPLPPSTALQTTLSLPAAGHRRLLLAMSNPRCASAVAVEVFQPAQHDPIFRGELAAHGASAPLSVEADKAGGGPLLVSINLAAGAENNWYCNIALSWNDQP